MPSKEVLIMQGYNERAVDYKKLHGVKEYDMQALIDGLELRNGETFADLMGGHGDVTISAINDCNEKGIHIKPLIIDKYPNQFPIEAPCTTIMSDVRKLPIGNECIDKAAIKLGLHEMKNKDKIKTLKEAHRILKKGGKIGLWEIGPKSEKEQKLFSKLMKKKDQLAGFIDMARNRRFASENELVGFLNQAGFTQITNKHTPIFEMNTKNWLEKDFQNDSTKLQEWNEYVRKQVPEKLKEKVSYKDEGETIKMKFNWPIIVATK